MSVREQIQSMQILNLHSQTQDSNLAGDFHPGNIPGLSCSLVPLLFLILGLYPATLSEYPTFCVLSFFFFLCLICTFFFGTQHSYFIIMCLLYSPCILLYPVWEKAIKYIQSSKHELDI